MLTSTNNGLCNAVMDQLTVTILPNATADAGPDQVICSSTDKVMLEGPDHRQRHAPGHLDHHRGGHVHPEREQCDRQLLAGQHGPGLGTLTFTWSVNSCDNAQDQMTVTIVPESVVDAGADLVTCFDDLDVGDQRFRERRRHHRAMEHTAGTFANPASANSNAPGQPAGPPWRSVWTWCSLPPVRARARLMPTPCTSTSRALRHGGRRCG